MGTEMITRPTGENSQRVGFDESRPGCLENVTSGLLQDEMSSSSSNRRVPGGPRWLEAAHSGGSGLGSEPLEGAGGGKSAEWQGRSGWWGSQRCPPCRPATPQLTPITISKTIFKMGWRENTNH